MDVQRRGIRAKQRLTATNLRLVVNIAKKWRRALNGRDADMEDLIQVGALGLNRGIELFDYTKGYQTSTYFFWWITQSIRKYLENNDIVRIPASLQERYTRLTKVIGTYEAEHGYRPSVTWLSETTGYTPAQIEDSIVIGRARMVLSLDARSNDADDASSFGDLMPSPGTPDAELIEDADMRDARLVALDQLINELPDERAVGVLRDQIAGNTIRDISIRLGVSRSRVGQIRAGAIERMRGTVAQDPTLQQLVA
jgi:RNA polymerase sigma factor (sigma-70 family)